MYLANASGQHIGFGPIVSVADGSVITGAPATIGLAGSYRIDGGTETALGGTFTEGALATGSYDYAPTQAETDGSNVTFTFTATGAYPIVITIAFWDATAMAALADAILSRSVSTVEATMPEHSLGSIVLQSLETAVTGPTEMTIYRTDGVTVHLTKTITTVSSPQGITSIN